MHVLSAERPHRPGNRKHRRSPSSSVSSDDAAAHRSAKRQRVAHPTVPPPAFWDGLSEVPLCASALRELDRRNKERESARENAKVAPDTTRRRSHRLRAGRTAADHDDRRQPAEQFLSRCVTPSSKEIRRSAKHGGPSLTDLRGVGNVLSSTPMPS